MIKLVLALLKLLQCVKTRRVTSSDSRSERPSRRTGAADKSERRAADGTHGGVGLDQTLLQLSGFLPSTGHAQTVQLAHLPAEHVGEGAHAADRTYTTGPPQRKQPCERLTVNIRPFQREEEETIQTERCCSYAKC